MLTKLSPSFLTAALAATLCLLGSPKLKAAEGQATAPAAGAAATATTEKAAATDKQVEPEKKKKKKNSDHVPYRGKLESINSVAMNIVLAGKEKNRTIHVTSHTKITKDGKPATFQDLKPGEEVAGQLVKAAAGEEAVSLKIGPKAEKAADGEKKPKKEKKAKKSEAPAAAAAIEPAK